MAGSAAVLAARMAKLGPGGDPLETITMSMVAYAQYAQAHALAEVEDIEQKRQALRDAEQ